MKGIMAIIKVILYTLLIYVIIPLILTLVLLFSKVFAVVKESVILYSGESARSRAEIEVIFQNALAGIRFDLILIGITIVSGIIGLLFIGLFFKIRDKKFTQELKIRKMIGSNKWFPLDKVAMLILVGITTNFISILILNFLPYPQEWLVDYTEKIDKTLMNNIWFNTLFAVFYAGIFEELFFRGLIYTRLKNGMNKKIAACLSALLFGLVHVSPVQIIYATIIGLILVGVFEIFDSVIPCIIIHMTNNFIGIRISTIPVEIAENYTFIAIYFIIMIVITVFATTWLVKQKKKIT